jgi:hypothetical protein
MFVPRTIAGAIDKVARKAIGKDWGLYAGLLDHWRDIVGEEYAKVATPVKICFPQGKTAGDAWAGGNRTDGVLHIRLPQGLAMEFSFLTDQIRQRITSCFGYSAIERIVFETFYDTTQTMVIDDAHLDSSSLPAVLPADLNDVEDDELRHALEGYGKAVLQGKKPS